MPLLPPHYYASRTGNISPTGRKSIKKDVVIVAVGHLMQLFQKKKGKWKLPPVLHMRKRKNQDA